MVIMVWEEEKAFSETEQDRRNPQGGVLSRKTGSRVPVAHALTAGEPSVQPFSPVSAATSRGQAQRERTVGGSETRRIA